MPTAATCRLLCLLVTLNLVASAQERKAPEAAEILNIAPPPSDRFPAKWYPRVGDGTDVLQAPVVGKPYTAILETVSLDPSPSGELARRVTRDFGARDRFGRTRSENVPGTWRVDGEDVPIKRVTIFDPVSHCEFTWTEPTPDRGAVQELRVAFVTCHPLTLRYKEFDLFATLDTDADGTNTHGDTTTQTEHLPPLQIDGVSVIRLRVTNSVTDEKGQVKKWSREIWYSPDLKEFVRLGLGEGGSMALTDIRQLDPDPKLFYPPAGYSIERSPDRK